jgi:regulator of protease activity HflC (stomatin/prohibitin superfamily)
MLGWKKFFVTKNERAVLMQNGDFKSVLRPGAHWIYAGFDGVTVERFSLNKSCFDSPLCSYLLANEPAVVAEHFLRVELTDTQAALRSENGVLVEVLAPGSRKLYWRDAMDASIEVIDVADAVQIDAKQVPRLAQSQLRSLPVSGLGGVLAVTVPQYSVGVLVVDGTVAEMLTAGSYAFWRFNRQVSVENIDLRLQALEVTGQEILTADKVALRLNLTASYRFADVQLAYSKLAKPGEHLYRELQFALRAAVGTRTLDQLLENKSVIDEVVSAQVVAKMQGYGIELDAVGVKDIILPGEMKTILTQVVEAEKSAQANVIRRREETAASRSLLNTAKVMEDNPVALRLKELETLERVAERIDKITVFGGLDSVLNALSKR